MAKMINKSELSEMNGYLCVSDGTIVAPVSDKVVRAYNALELAVQKRKFADKHGLLKPEEEKVTTDNFEFESAHEVKHGKVIVETPELDKAVARSMKIVDELNIVEQGETINQLIASCEPLIEFVNADHVIVEEKTGIRIDSINLPSILDITADNIIEYCAYAVTGIVPVMDEEDE